MKLTNKDEINLVSDWKTGRYSQRDLASKYNCSKGKVSQLTEGIEKGKNDQVVNAQITILTAKALLSDSEMTAIMTAAQNDIFNNGLITNATQLNLVRTMEYLSNNKKLEKVSAGAGIQELVEVGLGSSDFKECQDTIDKASLTLGINQRHSNSQVNIQNTNATQTNTNIIDIENMDAKQITNAYLDLIKQ